MVCVRLFSVSQNTATESPTWLLVSECSGDGCSEWSPWQVVRSEIESVMVP
ncbi:hypothetical protein HanPSC8_Chr14g0615461 [Helianthus annuus]|nr:hypothetical protein HanPSC8_Chr14g0615461 [Helianthus annuus]